MQLVNRRRDSQTKVWFWAEIKTSQKRNSASINVSWDSKWILDFTPKERFNKNETGILCWVRKEKSGVHIWTPSEVPWPLFYLKVMDSISQMTDKTANIWMRCYTKNVYHPLNMLCGGWIGICALMERTIELQ